MRSRETAVSIARRLRSKGFEALFAGGSVRDRLRGQEPKDYDLATSARPEQVLALFPKTIPVGAAFGVVLVVEGEEQFEVATFREDRGVADGRHPAEVRFAGAREDALRRDFTVNGMFEDPETGEVLDFVGGRADLAARVVRAIGEPALRFREDRLRMLRAVRFATVLDFRIDGATLAAVRDAAPSIADVSFERIRDELSTILTSGRGGRGLGLLFDTGLLEAVLPEVAALDGVPQPPRFHPEGDVLTHTRLLLDGYREGGEVVALAALLHDVGKPPTLEMKEGKPAFPGHAQVGAAMAADILRRLRYPNRVIEQVEELVDRHMDWPQLPKMREAKRRRLLLMEGLTLHMELHRLDCEACHGDTSIRDYALAERLRLEAEPPPTKPLLSGDDLIGMGFAPGPAFKEMLLAIVDAQLEGTVKDAEGARAFVRARYGEVRP